MVYNHINDTTMKKEFFWKDLSGRGFTNTFTLTELKKAFAGEKNDDGIAISTWAKAADPGDECRNAANKIERIK